MIIVTKHIARDPDSGFVTVVPNLADGVYPDLVVRKIESRAIGSSPTYCNPEPHSVRGFNIIGNY